MKKIISTREFRKNMKLYLDDVDMGSEVIITRKGKLSYSIVALHDCKTAVKGKIKPSKEEKTKSNRDIVFGCIKSNSKPKYEYLYEEILNSTDRASLTRAEIKQIDEENERMYQLELERQRNGYYEYLEVCVNYILKLYPNENEDDIVKIIEKLEKNRQISDIANDFELLEVMNSKNEITIELMQKYLEKQLFEVK